MTTSFWLAYGITVARPGAAVPALDIKRRGGTQHTHCTQPTARCSRVESSCRHRKSCRYELRSLACGRQDTPDLQRVRNECALAGTGRTQPVLTEL